jgi:zinc transporter 13
MFLGLWVLIGIISFVICEKLVTFANTEVTENTETEASISDSSNNNVEKPFVKGLSSENSHKHVRKSPRVCSNNNNTANLFYEKSQKYKNFILN